MSKTKELAQRLGFSAGQLALLTGYTRQGLCYTVENRPAKAANRLRVAVKAIKAEIEEDYQRGMQALEARKAERLAAAEELLYITKEGEP